MTQGPKEDTCWPSQEPPLPVASRGFYRYQGILDVSFKGHHDNVV